MNNNGDNAKKYGSYKTYTIFMRDDKVGDTSMADSLSSDDKACELIIIAIESSVLTYVESSSGRHYNPALMNAANEILDICRKAPQSDIKLCCQAKVECEISRYIRNIGIQVNIFLSPRKCDYTTMSYDEVIESIAKPATSKDDTDASSKETVIKIEEAKKNGSLSILWAFFAGLPGAAVFALAYFVPFYTTDVSDAMSKLGMSPEIQVLIGAIIAVIGFVTVAMVVGSRVKHVDRVQDERNRSTEEQLLVEA